MSEYERLTRKDKKGRWVAEIGFFGMYLKSDVSDTGEISYTNLMYGKLIDRLAELEDKIESGELVELPKKVLRGKDEIGENAYEVITTMSHLFYGERQADAFLEREKERLRGGRADELRSIQ